MVRTMRESRKSMEREVNELIKKVNALKKDGKLDLSRDEDLSIALMNLISIEEHLYFSGMKTEKKSYFEILDLVRKIRTKLMKELVRNGEGELWCVTKHLLASSMRLIEVGNKHFARGEEKEAFSKYRDAFYLYSLVWELNFNLTGSMGSSTKTGETNISDNPEKKMSLLASIVKKIVDCCKE